MAAFPLQHILHRLHNTSRLTLVQSIQRLHVFFPNFPSIYLGIALNPAFRITLRERHPPLLQTPTNQDLRHGLIELLSDRDECFIVCFLVADQGTVRFDHNGVLVAVFDYVTLLAPGM